MMRTRTKSAVSKIRGGEKAPNIRGTVSFYQRPQGVLVVAQVMGLPKTESGFFGLHIHTGTACAGAEFSETGAHFNPGATEHPNHAGDLPPLLYCNGGAYMSVLTDRFSVRDIVGKTVVIHSNADDFTTQPAGNAGEKIACGVIRLV